MTALIDDAWLYDLPKPLIKEARLNVMMNLGKNSSIYSRFFFRLLSQGDIGYQLKALDGGALFVGMCKQRCESRCQPWNVIMQKPSTSFALQKKKEKVPSMCSSADSVGQSGPCW